MRLRKLVAAGLIAVAAPVAITGTAHAEDPGKKFGKELVECVETALKDNESEIAKKDYTSFENARRRLQEGEEHHHAGRVRDHLGRPRVPDRPRAAGEVRLPGAARRASRRARTRSATTSRAPSTPGRRPRRSAPGTRPSSPTLAEKANRIVEEAREAAEQVRRDVTARAEADAADIRTRANDDITAARDRAMSDLRGRVADLSIELAEKIVERNLDRDTQVALIESYISSVGERLEQRTTAIEAYAAGDRCR